MLRYEEAGEVADDIEKYSEAEDLHFRIRVLLDWINH
jgi:hypothetical protein